MCKQEGSARERGAPGEEGNAEKRRSSESA